MISNIPTFEPSIENFGEFPLSSTPVVAAQTVVDATIPLTSFDKVNDAIDKINNNININISKINDIETSVLDTQEKYEVTKLLISNILTSVNELQTLNSPRIDKLISNQDIVEMIYDVITNKLVRINYTNSYHEIFLYGEVDNSTKLIKIQHFYDEVLKGETTLNYINKKLNSLLFVSKE